MIARKPSVKTLSAVFNDPAAARAVFEMSHAELSAHPIGAARISECWNRPAWYDVRLTILASLDNGLHGVESAQSVGGEYADYLNTGDSYAPTIIFWRGKYRVQSIGDFIESSRVVFQ